MFSFTKTSVFTKRIVAVGTILRLKSSTDVLQARSSSCPMPASSNILTCVYAKRTHAVTKWKADWCAVDLRGVTFEASMTKNTLTLQILQY